MKRIPLLMLSLLLALTTPSPGRCDEGSPAGTTTVAAPSTEDLPPAAVSRFRERPYRVWPIYYHRSFTPEHERTIYGPLWLTERDRETTLTYPLWPFTGVTRTEGVLAKFDIIWPITGYQRQENGEEFNLLWPVTGYSSSAAPNRESASLFLVKPLLGYYRQTTRDPASGQVSGEQTGYLPFYYGSKTGGTTFRYVFPSFLGGEGSDGESSWHSLLPFYFYAGSPDSTYLFILPSYLRLREPGRNLYSFIPFFHADEKPTGRSLYVFPSYFRSSSSDGDSLTGLLPFYVGRSTSDGDSFRYIFPTYFNTSSGNGASMTGLLPLYLEQSASDGDSFRYIFPSWIERHRERYDSTWFPPFFTATDDATGDTSIHRRSVLWPLYLSEEGDDGRSRTSLLLNLFYRRVDPAAEEQFTTILWPLVTYDKSPRHRELRIWPYAYENDLTDNYRAHHLLWPLIGFGSGDHQSMTRFLPLFYRRETPDSSLTLSPLYLESRTPERRFSLLIPLYGSYAGAGQKWTVLLPVAWGESEGRKFSLLFPAWYRASRGDDTDNLFLNTWWSREGERSTFAFIPLYYRSATPTESRNLLLNTWWSREGERSTFAFVPLYFRSATPTESRNILLNTWWSGGERLERLVFFPLAWYHSPAPEERDFTLFPLFSYGEKGPGNTTLSFLWRLYYQRREGDSSMAAFLWWLYRSEERPGFRRLMCWPFIDYEQNSGASDEVFTSFLLRFVTYERNGERRRIRLLGMTLHET